MHPSIRNDQNLRELALAEARNAVGPDEPLSVFLAQECLTLQEYEAISKNPTYKRYVKDFKAELTENGFSFSAKARVLAEDLLGDIYLMAKDVDTPAQMRVKTLENLVEWGRLAPKQTQNDLPGSGFSITINLPGQNGSITVGASSPTPPADSPMADVVDPPPKTVMKRLPVAPAGLDTDDLDLDTEFYYELAAVEGDVPPGELFA